MPATHLQAAIAIAAAVALAGCTKSPAIRVTNVPAPSFAASQAAASLPAPTGPLTIETAAQRAVTWHPAVREAVARLGQQEAGVMEARAGYGPKFGWDLGSVCSEGSSFGQPKVTLTGSQTIYDFGKVDGRVRVATAGTEQGRANVRLAVDKLAYETATAMLKVQRNREMLAIANERIPDTQAILELVRSRASAGASTQSDLRQAEARLQAAHAAALEIETELRRWESIVLSLTATTPPLRIAASTPAWLNGACPTPDGDLKHTPAVLEAEARQAIASAQLDLLKAEVLPSLELRGSLGGGFSALSRGEPDYRVGLTFTGSLYDGGASAAKMQAAQHAAEASEAAVAVAKLDAQRGLAEANSQLSSLKRLKGALGKNISALDETRKLYRSQYEELGTRTLLDLLNAEDEYHLARIDEASVGFDLSRRSLECVYNAGALGKAVGLTGKTVQGVVL